MSSIKYFDAADFQAMEKRFRTTFFNSLSGFKSANLIGTQDTKGITNLSLVSSVVHIGANPPLMGFIMRPVSVQRDTYQNLLATGYFTINHVHEGIYAAAHQSSARYPAEISEFDAVGLNREFREAVKAPYVAESRLKIGLVFREQVNIHANETILLIGEVAEVIVSEDYVSEDGYIAIEEAGSLAISSLDGYHRTSSLGRFSYAKPDRDLKKL